MRTWEGNLTIVHSVSRSPDGPRDVETVHARIVLATDGAEPVVDVAVGKDGAGATRWRPAQAREFDPKSFLRALAMTAPEKPG